MIRALAAAVLAVALTGIAPAARPPLVIASEGYLFVGGALTTTGKQPLTDQMYVEYQIPQTRTHRYPIVMIEGGGQTGANFTGTPAVCRIPLPERSTHSLSRHSSGPLAGPVIASSDRNPSGARPSGPCSSQRCSFKLPPATFTRCGGMTTDLLFS